MAVPHELQRSPHPKRPRGSPEQGRRAHWRPTTLGSDPLLGQRRPAQILHHQCHRRKNHRRRDLARTWQRGQRCILPALGFYEWQVLPDGKSKQLYYITLNDQHIFGFAGLWDSSAGADGIKIESCTIVTMPANKLMAEIHNAKHRMPAILAKEDLDTWLTAAPEEAFTVIKQYPDTHMVATPVSKRVNTPKNNDAELIAPILAA